MATVNKDFKIKAGLVVEGTTGTINGEDIITTGNSTDILNEGTTNLYYTESRAKTDAAELLTGATLTNITITGDGNGLTITAENGGIQDLTGFDTDDLVEGVTNLYFTNQRALDATASAYDVAGAASNVAGDLSNHISDLSAHGVTGDVVGTTDTQTLSNKTITSLVITDTGSYIEGDSGNVTLHAAQDLTLSSTGGDIIFAPDGNTFIGSSGTAGNQVATHDYADGVANTAQTNAESYIDAQLTNYTTTANLDTTVGGYGYIKSAALSGYATESYVGTAISNLVDSAPDTLNTLNELAAALGDDASFATTIATSIGEKVAKSGDTMTGFLTLSAAPTSDLHAATKKYVDDAIGGVTNISEVVLPDALLGSETATAGTSSTVVDSWSATTYSTAKYLVQMKSGSNIHVLEVLVTVDGSNNVYVTEYAEVISNTSLGTTDAAYNAGNVEFTVTATNAGTSVKISKTLIEA